MHGFLLPVAGGTDGRGWEKHVGMKLQKDLSDRGHVRDRTGQKEFLTDAVYPIMLPFYSGGLDMHSFPMSI